MEYLFAVYSVFSFSHSEVDILLQTQCLSLNFDFDYHESKLAHVHHILDKLSYN